MQMDAATSGSIAWRKGTHLLCSAIQHGSGAQMGDAWDDRGVGGGAADPTAKDDNWQSPPSIRWTWDCLGLCGSGVPLCHG